MGEVVRFTDTGSAVCGRLERQFVKVTPKLGAEYSLDVLEYNQMYIHQQIETPALCQGYYCFPCHVRVCSRYRL
jgi:hypothetical protein